MVQTETLKPYHRRHRRQSFRQPSMITAVWLCGDLFVPNMIRSSSVAISSTTTPGIILCMGSANERRRYIVTSSLIGWTHIQNDPWILFVDLYRLAITCTPIDGMHYQATRGFLQNNTKVTNTFFSFWRLIYKDNSCNKSSNLRLRGLDTRLKLLKPAQNGRHFAEDIFNAFYWMTTFVFLFIFHWN